MGKKTLSNAHCLFELIEKAQVANLRAFSRLPECTALARGFDWSQPEDAIPGALIEHIKHLRSDQRDPAEREALRVLRLATPRGAAILATVADQLHDSDLIDVFRAQEGGEIGRAVWMRTHSDDSAKLFDVAESILNTGDLRGNKRLHDAFDVPCVEAPPFLWNDAVKKVLEAELTRAMRLAEPCELVHIEMTEDDGRGGAHKTHYLVVRFAGDQVTAVQVIDRNRRSFCYFPARDATLIYAPQRKMVEVYAHTLSTRAPLANVLSRYGFKIPLSNRPLDRSRYDLSRFARPLTGLKPRLDGARVERLYLIEAKALLGHATDAVTLHVDSGCELQEVIGERWPHHPFVQPGAILGVTLVAELVFDGDTQVTPLSIVLAEPGRCSLAGEKDQRLRRAGMQLLEALGVRKPLHPGSGVDDPSLIAQVARLLECASGSMDGFALAKLGIDIDRFEDEGILTEGERITETVVELAQGERTTVRLDLDRDPGHVSYRDPLSGEVVCLPAQQARRWKVHLGWMREEIVHALGTALKAVGGRLGGEDPVFLGEIELDAQTVAVYFAEKMSHERRFAKVDSALRLQARDVPGIVLTTSPEPYPFAGTNIVIPIEDVLARGESGERRSAIDMQQLAVIYRHHRLAAMGGASVSLKVATDGHSATLYLPGKAPWKVTSRAKILVLRRLAEAYLAGNPPVQSKILMKDTGCDSPGNLFAKNSPWRQYIVRVKGAYAWQLNVSPQPVVVEDDDAAGTEPQVSLAD